MTRAWLLIACVEVAGCCAAPGPRRYVGPPVPDAGSRFDAPFDTRDAGRPLDADIDADLDADLDAGIDADIDGDLDGR